MPVSPSSVRTSTLRFLGLPWWPSSAKPHSSSTISSVRASSTSMQRRRVESFRVASMGISEVSPQHEDDLKRAGEVYGRAGEARGGPSKRPSERPYELSCLPAVQSKSNTPADEADCKDAGDSWPACRRVQSFAGEDQRRIAMSRLCGLECG